MSKDNSMQIGSPGGWEDFQVPMQGQQVPLHEPPCSPIPHSSPGGTDSPGMIQPTPSPAGKRFIGVYGNARNDIYMKSLMNSPYHKSYTPLSATPGYSPGPFYQTPVWNGDSSPVRSVAPSPKNTGSRPPSARKFVTPKGAVNPFESGIDELERPAYMSPGFFTVTSTPASEKCFRWSIEHIAELNPADIDEMPVKQCISKPDKETEERAQKAIEQFFANNLIAPSPWSDPKKSKRKNILPATPASQGPGGAGIHDMMTELQGSIQKTLPPKQGMEDVSCQTVLSLPLNFDLQKVLGAYMTQEEVSDGNQQEMLSTSSLRRKLFFHGDTSSLAPSPVKAVSGEALLEPASPMFHGQDKDLDWAGTTPLKNTPAFSSSPIKSMGTPLRRRCSSDPEFLVSPELSPIVHGNIPNSGIRKSRSSGMFGMDDGSFNVSPMGDKQTQQSPESSSQRNGKFSENHFEDFHPKFADSPGFSPIRPPKTPIRKILRRSQEESYIQDEGCTSEDESDSITPVSSNPKVQTSLPSTIDSKPKVQTSLLSPVDTLSPIHKLSSHHESFFSKSKSNTNHMPNVMDFELAPTALENRFTDNILTSSLCETRDFSSDIDFQDETHLQTNSSNQDTGYQTASLQSTNPESVSLHTNLTNQFGSLPFNLTNQELGLQNLSQISTNRDKAPPIINLAKQFLNTEDSEEEEFEVTEVRRVNKSFDKQSLPKQNLFAQNMFTSDESDTETTPKNQRLIGDDSAFREHSSMFDADSGNMEVDPKKDCLEFYPNEKDVLSRARQALAMANSLYPRETSSKPVHDEMADSSQEMPEDNAKSKLTASEFAFSVLQKAGADLAKFEHMFSGN